MPGFFISEDSIVTCSHLGDATPMEVLPSVLLLGAPAVGISSPYGVVGCTLPPPIVANGPCVSGMFLTPSLCVFSFGVPLVLNTSESICAPGGTPLIVAETQLQVAGM